MQPGVPKGPFDIRGVQDQWGAAGPPQYENAVRQNWRPWGPLATACVMEAKPSLFGDRGQRGRCVHSSRGASPER